MMAFLLFYLLYQLHEVCNDMRNNGFPYFPPNQVDDDILITLLAILGFSDVFLSFILYNSGFDHNFYSSSPDAEREHSNQVPAAVDRSCLL